MKTLIPSAFVLALLTSTAGAALAQEGPGQVEVNLDGVRAAIEASGQAGSPPSPSPRFEEPAPRAEPAPAQLERRGDRGVADIQDGAGWVRRPSPPDIEPGPARVDPRPVVTQASPGQDRHRHDDDERLPQSFDPGRRGDGSTYVPPPEPPRVTQPTPQVRGPSPDRGGSGGDRTRPAGRDGDHNRDRDRDHGRDDHRWRDDTDQHRNDRSGRSWNDRNDWQWRDQPGRDWQWRGQDDFRDWGGSRRPYYSQHRYRGWDYRPPYGFYAHDWRYGEYMPPSWWASNNRILDWWNYGLPRPPLGYQWVRVGDDAVLADKFNGRVIQIVYDLFW